MQLLLEYGADVNALDSEGPTALDVAFKEKTKTSDENQKRRDKLDQIIALLQEHGAIRKADGEIENNAEDNEN